MRINRVATTAVLTLCAAFGLAALLAPSSAQTPIAPEATPEFWPLAFDPASVEVDPDAFTLLFQAPRRCQLSPNNRDVYVDGYGVYEIATGRRYSDLVGDVVAMSAGSPYLQVRGLGVFNYETKAQTVATYYNRAGTFSPDGRWFIDYQSVFDVETGEYVTFLYRWGDGSRSTSGIAFAGETGTSLHYSADVEGIEFLAFMDTTTWQLDNDIFPLLDRMRGAPSVLVTHDFAVIGNDGVYSLDSYEKLFSIADEGTGWWGFGAGETLLFRYRQDGDVSFYRMPDGALVQQFAIPDFSRPYVSPDGKTLIVEEYEQVTGHIPGMLAAEPVALHLFDIPTGTLRAVLPFGSNPSFNEDGTQISIDGHGVYDVMTGTQISPSMESNWRQFDDNTYFTTTVNDEFIVADAPDGNIRLTLDYRGLSFARGSRWVYARGSGVYDVTTGEEALALPENNFRFNADATMLYSSESPCAIYAVPQG